MDNSIRYIGLDVHKDTIAVAVAEAGRQSDVREYGKIANTPAALKTLAVIRDDRLTSVPVDRRHSIARDECRRWDLERE